MAGQFINAPSPSRREARNFENELDIVIVGNKSDKNVTSGQYVTVRDSSISGITNGIYKATANVAAGTAFVAANLSAVTSGALNDLNGNLANKANITGTPEIVSNSNGVAYKFPNGLMICTKQVDLTCAITTAWGSLYESPKQSLGSFAQSFTSTPDISLQSVVKDGTYYNCFIEGLTSRSASNVGEIWLLRPVSTASAKYCISVIAVGRWK